MSAKAQTDDGIPEEITNGINLDTDEPITHSYDRVGHIVLAECVCCIENTRRRLLERDYDLDEYFKQPLDDSEFWLPTEIYRPCEQCGRETTHFVV